MQVQKQGPLLPGPHLWEACSLAGEIDEDESENERIINRAKSGEGNRQGGGLWEHPLC